MKFYIIIPILFLLASCKNTSEESSFEREKRMIDEYHRKVVESKGEKTFFIPKNEISWYFNNKKKISLENAIIGDNISFFDTLGNIQYQAIIDTIIDKKIVIECLDLMEAEYYFVELKIENIRDLKSNYPYEIKIFR